MDSDTESFTVVHRDASGSDSWMTSTDHIRKYQETYQNLECDRLLLERMKTENEQDGARLHAEAEHIRKKLRELEEEARCEEAAFKRMLEQEQLQRKHLLQQKQDLEKELEQLRESQEKLPKMPVTYPERAVVFKGHVEKQDKNDRMKEAEEGAPPDMVTIATQIRCPVSGGSALITFEDPEVASRIITAGQHRVKVDDWSYVHVTAKPVLLPLPSCMEISLKQRPRQILISGLEEVSLSDDQLFDKIALFFSLRRNGGNEVACVERLTSSGHLVVTFVDNGVSEQLIERGRFEMPIGKEKTCELKVSHYMGGDVTELQFHSIACARTVLLSEIPDILDEELMREALQIHFQKPSKGGGEVEAVAYVPEGQSALAVFEDEKD